MNDIEKPKYQQLKDFIIEKIKTRQVGIGEKIYSENELAESFSMILGCTLLTKPEKMYRALIEATAYGTRMIVEAAKYMSKVKEEYYKPIPENVETYNKLYMTTLAVAEMML